MAAVELFQSPCWITVGVAASVFLVSVIHTHFFERTPLFEEAVIVTDRRTKKRRVSFGATTFNPFHQQAELQALVPMPFFVSFAPGESVACKDRILEGIVIKVELEARRDGESVLRIIERFGRQSQSELLQLEMEQMNSRAQFYERFSSQSAREYRQEYDRLMVSHKCGLEEAFEESFRAAFRGLAQQRTMKEILTSDQKLSEFGREMARTVGPDLSGYQLVGLQILHCDSSQEANV